MTEQNDQWILQPQLTKIKCKYLKREKIRRNKKTYKDSMESIPDKSILVCTVHTNKYSKQRVLFLFIYYSFLFCFFVFSYLFAIYLKLTITIYEKLQTKNYKIKKLLSYIKINQNIENKDNPLQSDPSQTNSIYLSGIADELFELVEQFY